MDRVLRGIAIQAWPGMLLTIRGSLGHNSGHGKPGAIMRAIMQAQHLTDPIAARNRQRPAAKRRLHRRSPPQLTT